ncbi:unnamed protein product [Anisakis simplex]|uniref:TAFH domain-containing protein n=1 Tax=Anisakis simplex TaxID=6269 RepID=A0A0M3JTW2_ANISI|nr:unnamed protein product [Anisakis simplex]
MGDGVQQSGAAQSGGGPRFRIVPGPMLGENSRSNGPRNCAVSQQIAKMITWYGVEIQPQAYPNDGSSMKQDEMSNSPSINRPQTTTSSSPHMIISGTPLRQQQQAVQCVVMNNQAGVSMNGSALSSSNAITNPATPNQHKPLPSSASVTSTATVTAQQQRPTTAPNAAEQASMVSKCARFFKTLIHLSQQPDQQQGQQTAVRVTELVKVYIHCFYRAILVIYGTMPPEEFTSRLQQALRSQAQPHLLPFLQKTEFQTLPALRAAMQKGEVVIEGIDAQPCQNQPQPQQHSLSSSNELQNSPQWDASNRRSNNDNVTYIQQVNNNSSVGPQVDRQANVAATTSSSTSLNQNKTESTSNSLSNDESNSLSQVESVETAMTCDSDLRSLPANYAPYRLLNVDVLTRKIQRAMPDGGQTVSDEVTSIISKAAENRLRAVIARLSVIAEHRLEQLRNHPMYQALDDTRRQLRFLEELDRREHERRENREKEALIRLSKSKSKDKDTLVEKAKQLQRADQEAARNRDANAAAIAALGGRKSNKRSWADTNNPFEQSISMGLSASVLICSLRLVFTHRPRTKRVTMRDFQFLLSHDPLSCHSVLRLRLSLFNTPIDLHPS